MPPTSAKSNFALGIRLEGGRTTFAPGDTIVGCVYRWAHIVSTEAVIKIALSGKAHVQVSTDSRSRGTSAVYRGRSTLIDEKRHAQIIFQGPLHIPEVFTPEAEQSWPFAITIPMHTDVLMGSPDQGGRASSPVSVTQRDLPGTFAMDHGGFGVQDEGFVEYTVKAEMHCNKGGSAWTATAVLPIRIRSVSLEPPIVDFQLTKQRLYGSISSHRRPSMEHGAGSSLSQKAKALLNSTSKVPILAGNMEIHTPSIIQLENPNPIPLLLRFVQDSDIPGDSCGGSIPKMQLTMFSMEIQSTTELSCDGAPRSWAVPSPATMQISVWSPLVFGASTPPLYVPCTGEDPPVDVGLKVNLRLGYTGMMGKTYSQGRIQPSFALRNLKHTHRVSYELKVMVSGEELKLRWSNDVTILSPTVETGGDAVREEADWALMTRSQTADTDEPAPPPFEETWIRPPPTGDARSQSRTW